MNIAPAVLTAFVEQLFAGAGLRMGDARFCAETHVRQEIRGVTTHGLRHVPLVLEGLTHGRMNPRPNRTVLREDGATVVLDGDNGAGTLGCMEAMESAIAKAKQFGVGIGIVIRNNHFLSAAPYCLRAVEHAMIGICCSNTWASMGYPGTNVRAIANSPIGFGVPTAAEFPVIFDCALTTSGGKLAKWIREGQSIPPALLGTDSEGNPSANPAAVLHGGTPRPIGDHKGAGLAVLVEVLTGVLGGGGFLHGVQSPELRTSPENGESQCCIAIDIARFMPLEEFRQRMVAFIADLKGNPLAPGQSEILLPGERAHRIDLLCLENGVPLEADVATDLRAWAQRLKVDCPF
jgi:LDH2 family malate/lactate/ureidoglycolate dehydrogenase